MSLRQSDPSNKRNVVMKKSIVTGMLLATVSMPLTAGELSVAVAANFTDATRDIVPLFEKETGHKVKVSFGSTGKLYSQIENGAPFEVFLAADSKRPKKAEAENLAVKGSRFTYAMGKLALWSPQAGLFDSAEEFLNQASFAHIAIANPKTAPYGLAAQQVLKKVGVWDKLQGKIVRGDSISQTFQFVASGNAETGFVALSQVRAWKEEKGTLWNIPQSYYAPIEQQAVLLKKGEGHVAAEAFLEFLRGSKARKVITGYGYGVK
jgi:molybdate transport system substrate-binding protein